MAGYVAARERAGGNGALPTSTGRFALDREYVNLTTFLLAPHPGIVREAIARHRRELDANAALYLSQSERALEDAARAAAARYLGAEPEQIALTDSTTMGLGLVYARLRLKPGDEVVTTEHEFYATHEALRLRQALDGVTVRRIRLYGEPGSASSDAMVAAVAGALGPRTRCLALTWVHSSSGVKLPLREIADAVELANRGRPQGERILLCIDGVHGFGVEDASPVELGADVFVSGCHNWLFGPRGTGFVWAAPHAWERLAPTIPSFDERAYLAWVEGRAPSDTPPGPLMTPGGFHSFEHRWALAEAFRFHDELGGKAKVAATTRALAARLKDGLAEIRGVTVKTRDDALSSGLVCADLVRTTAPDAVARLRDEYRVVASATPYATRYLRFRTERGEHPRRCRPGAGGRGRRRPRVTRALAVAHSPLADPTRGRLSRAPRRQHEPRAKPWRLRGQALSYARTIASDVVSFRLRSTRIEAKAKLSHDKPPASKGASSAALEEPGPYQQPRLTEEIRRVRVARHGAKARFPEET